MNFVKSFKTILLILFFLANLFGQDNFSSVQSIIDEVSIDSLVHTVSVLSGEESFNMNGNTYQIMSRYMNHPHNDLAADYLKSRLENYGYGVFDQYYISSQNAIDGKGRNLYAVKEGSEYPEKKFIFCAHYDAISSSTTAPGADDNGSGTAAVIEAARLLAEVNTKYTIIFALWDEEELGMIGSQYYANKAYGDGEDIVGVINMDMIAYDSDDDYRCDIHVTDIVNSFWLRDKMVEINDRHSLGLDIDIHNFGTFSSDQSSFWNKNYSALLLIEDYKGNLNRVVNDFNYWYHTFNDRLFAFNNEYYLAMSKLAIGTIAELSEIVETTGTEKTEGIPTDLVLKPNYPNPFNPSTIISYDLPSATNVKLTVYDILGNEVAVVVDKYQSAGNYSVSFDASKKGLQLSSGFYVYQLITEYGLKTKKMILAK